MDNDDGKSYKIKNQFLCIVHKNGSEIIEDKLIKKRLFHI